MMDVSVRLLQESELQEADRIFRLAFGTFIKLADPMQFCGDAGYFHHRWKTDPSAAFAAEVDGQLVGSIIAVNWGSFGYFGTVKRSSRLLGTRSRQTACGGCVRSL
uniref:Uncharacterized protein n=1 Tax=Desertifilum tharense IPPAS B-1220 TaxID=1781255 RepID=A0ACD5GND0_9CYAN